MKILGVNTRTYPKQPGAGWDPDGTTVSVVLVAGEIGDYAAYAGTGTTQWIALYGDKVSFDEACIHFPGGQLTRDLYRA